MGEIDDILAELQALTEHVKALHKELSIRGFTMASETRNRLDQAETFILTAERLQGDEASKLDWIRQATSVADILRAEAGQTDAGVTASPK